MGNSISDIVNPLTDLKDPSPGESNLVGISGIIPALQLSLYSSARKSFEQGWPVIVICNLAPTRANTRVAPLIKQIRPKPEHTICY